MKFIAKDDVYLSEIIADNPLSITEISVPQGFELLTEGVFSPFKNLVRVELPESLHSLDADCFAGCDKLEEIVMPGVTEIYKEYFRGCVSVKKLLLPKALRAIGSDAFTELTSLKSIEFEGLDNFEYYGFVAFNGLTDRKVKLPTTSSKPVYEYTSDMGEYHIDEEAAKKLSKKAPVVQARSFTLIKHYNNGLTSLEPDFSGLLCERTETFLKDFRKVEGFIMDGKLLVGYMLKVKVGIDEYITVPVLAGGTAPYEVEEHTEGGDNNGAGYKGGESFTAKSYLTMIYY